MHAPLIVPLRQSRAGKLGPHSTSGARMRKFSALHLLSADSLLAYKCLPLCGLLGSFDGFRKIWSSNATDNSAAAQKALQ